MIKKVLSYDDQRFYDSAVYGFGGWLINLGVPPKPLFRETLENFAAIQNRGGRLRRSAKLFALHLQSLGGDNW